MAAPVADMGAARAIADFSDNEETMNNNEASEDEQVTYNKPRGALAARMAAAPKTFIHDDSASANEELTDNISKAAGFAARMRALESKKILDSSSEEEDDKMKGLSARERMRRMLQKEKEPQQPEPPKPISAPIISIHTSQSSDENEETLPVSSKPRNRRMRRSSPAREESPDPMSGGPAEESLFFSSPMKPPQDTLAEASDNDVLPDLTEIRATSTFKALLAKKKAERLAKEAAEEEARRIRHAETRELLADASSDSEADRAMEGIPNLKMWHDKHGRTKRTSRKAMEDELRETQRLARNMQLAHEIMTKKKISKQSLFARFNYKAEGMDEEEPSSSPRKITDVTSTQEEETPATSPLAQEPQSSGEATKKPSTDSRNISAPEEDEVPVLEEALNLLPRRFTAAEKGKGITPSSPNAAIQHPPVYIAKQIRVLNPRITARTSMSADDDSDDDLEIVKRKPIKTKKDMDEIFRNVPAKKKAESGGMHALRLLANLTSPSKVQTKSRQKGARPNIGQAELTMTLQQKARQQAAREREEKLNELRAKGVHIPTREEKEAEQNEVIDLVARAREENARIRKEERKAQKVANIQAGIVDPLDDSDDSDDEDWDEDASKKRETSVSESDEEADDEIEFSGSEDDSGEEVNSISAKIIDDSACESENDKDEEMVEAEAADFISDASDSDEEVAPILTAASSRRRPRKSQIVDSDDEAEAEDITPTISIQNTPRPQTAKTPGSVRFLVKSPAAPTSVLRSATKNFIPGIPVNGAVGLGLTQIFAGTMDSQADFDDSPMPSPFQDSSSQSAFERQQDSLTFHKTLSPPDFGGSAPCATVEMDVIPCSQADIDTQESNQAVNLTMEQSQPPEMTQDQGLSFMSPIKGRYSATPVPTMDTVIIAGTPQLPEVAPSFIADSVVGSTAESPARARKGKLRQKSRTPITFMGSEREGDSASEDDFALAPNSIVAMRLAAIHAKAERRARKEREEFDKQKSKAREMVDEAATESEDEYAGLGGVSGSDSDSDDEALNEQMLDETKLSRKGKAEIQALAAKMDLEEDEARVNKLYKDITTGGIRRKRGADYDLSDSDDDGEARRRMKRREFAKMRKALLEDKNVGKIVANPKSAAFLKSLEDREDDMDIDDDFGGEKIVDIDHATNSQLPAEAESQDNQNVSEENSLSEGAINFQKPPSRLPLYMRTRGIQEDKRASSLAEIRANVSQLLEDPNTVHLGDDSSSDSELDTQDADDTLSAHEELLSDDEEVEQEDTTVILGDTSVIKTRKEKGKGKENLDPFASRRSSVAVVDRSLSRQNSAASDGPRMAFGPSANVSAGFKVPPFLKRATSNAINSAASSFSGNTSASKLAADRMGHSGGGTVRKQGYKGFAKEEQRQKVIEEGEQKRIQKKLKGVQERRRTVGVVFGSGKFE